MHLVIEPLAVRHGALPFGSAWGDGLHDVRFSPLVLSCTAIPPGNPLLQGTGVAVLIELHDIVNQLRFLLA
jgi:hypothetical protein